MLPSVLDNDLGATYHPPRPVCPPGPRGESAWTQTDGRQTSSPALCTPSASGRRRPASTSADPAGDHAQQSGHQGRPTSASTRNDKRAVTACTGTRRMRPASRASDREVGIRHLCTWRSRGYAADNVKQLGPGRLRRSAVVHPSRARQRTYGVRRRRVTEPRTTDATTNARTMARSWPTSAAGSAEVVMLRIASTA